MINVYCYKALLLKITSPCDIDESVIRHGVHSHRILNGRILHRFPRIESAQALVRCFSDACMAGMRGQGGASLRTQSQPMPAWTVLEYSYSTPLIFDEK